MEDAKDKDRPPLTDKGEEPQSPQSEELADRCLHTHVQCVNDFELVPKYRCPECNLILICSCERARSAVLLLHQTHFAKTPAQHRLPVDGYAEGICHFCRSEPMEPAPRAPIFGRRGKVERYYWREIKRSYYEAVVRWLRQNGEIGLTLTKFEKGHPIEAKQLRRAALQQWQKAHAKTPLYDMREENQQDFLVRVPVPIEELIGESKQRDRRDGSSLGRWVAEDGRLLSAERYAAEHYKRIGWKPYRCERRLISTLCAVLLNQVIQDPSDPKARLVRRRSTKGWTKSTPNTPIVEFLLPEDFGTREHFRRREDEYRAAFAEILSASNLEVLFDASVGPSPGIRDYLNVHEAEVETARVALSVLPRPLLLRALEWTLHDFWHRFQGWPDLFLVQEDRFRFSEVKTPKDRLSLAQMRWFEWALSEGIPASICKLCPRST